MLIQFKAYDIFDGHYRLLRLLSNAGGTADVWLAIDLNTIDTPIGMDDTPTESQHNESTAMKVAIKIYRPQSALDIEGEQRFRDEFKNVFNCHHANLIPPTQFGITGETPYLVMPYCSRGSSETLAGRLTAADDIWKYVGDVAAGLAYLHAMEPPIVHQDIKPANVLIDDNGNYAITDFGISATRDRHQAFDDASGTLAYMAPERFGTEDLKPESDIYAFGASLFEMITGQVPFGEGGGQSQPNNPVQLNFFGRNVPQSLKKLIAACLDHDPSQRPTAAQLVEAARHRTFPLTWWRSHRKALLASAACLAVVLGAALFIGLRIVEPKVTPVPTVDVEALYNSALRLANSDNVDSVRAGMNLFDTLAMKHDHIPACYEIVRTYGIRMRYSRDTATYNRRQRLLGVEMGNDGARAVYKDLFPNTDSHQILKDIPKNREGNAMATTAALRAINAIDKNLLKYSRDTATLQQGIDCAFTLGVFSLLCDNNLQEAKKYFRKTAQYEQQVGDTLHRGKEWYKAVDELKAN